MTLETTSDGGRSLLPTGTRSSSSHATPDGQEEEGGEGEQQEPGQAGQSPRPHRHQQCLSGNGTVDRSVVTLESTKPVCFSDTLKKRWVIIIARIIACYC